MTRSSFERGVQLSLVGAGVLLVLSAVVPTEAGAQYCRWETTGYEDSYYDGADAKQPIVLPGTPGQQILSDALTALEGPNTYTHVHSVHNAKATKVNNQTGHLETPVPGDSCDHPLHSTELFHLRTGYLYRQREADSFWSAQGYKSGLSWRDGFAVNATASCPYQSTKSCENIGCRYSIPAWVGRHTTGKENQCSEFQVHQCGVPGNHSLTLSYNTAFNLWSQFVDYVTQVCIDSGAVSFTFLEEMVCGSTAVSCNKAGYQYANAMFLDRNSSGYDFNSYTWSVSGQGKSHVTPKGIETANGIDIQVEVTQGDAIVEWVCYSTSDPGNCGTRACSGGR